MSSSSPPPQQLQQPQRPSSTPRYASVWPPRLLHPLSVSCPRLHPPPLPKRGSSLSSLWPPAVRPLLFIASIKPHKEEEGEGGCSLNRTPAKGHHINFIKTSEVVCVCDVYTHTSIPHRDKQTNKQTDVCLASGNPNIQSSVRLT